MANDVLFVKRFDGQGNDEMATKTTSSLFSIEDFHYQLTVGREERIGALLRNKSKSADEVLKLSKHLIDGKKNPVLMDIGGGIGAWTVPMASYIKNTNGKVISFEPQRKLYFQLCSNCAINDIRNCYVHNIGISDITGEAAVLVHQIRASGETVFSSATNESEFDKRKFTSLDEGHFPYADLIRIDMAGNEINILSGARQWLTNAKFPPVIFELHGDSISFFTKQNKKLLKFIHEELEYEVHFLNGFCIAHHRYYKIALESVASSHAFSRLPNDEL